MKLYEREKEVLIAFAQNDNNMRKTGKALYMAQASVFYHIEQIQKRTGLNARNFFDLGKLLEAAGYIGGADNVCNRL